MLKFVRQKLAEEVVPLMVLREPIAGGGFEFRFIWKRHWNSTYSKVKIFYNVGEPEYRNVQASVAAWAKSRQVPTRIW